MRNRGIRRPASAQQHSRAVRGHRVMHQGRDARSADRGAVDRAAGARSGWPASAEAVGGRRRLERRGHRRAGENPGTLRRRCGLEPEAGVTRLLTPPAAIDVTLGPSGAPESISGALTGSIDPIARWKIETSWWDRPVVREYWKAVLNNSLLCKLYHHLSRNEWFIERVYD